MGEETDPETTVEDFYNRSKDFFSFWELLFIALILKFPFSCRKQEEN